MDGPGLLIFFYAEGAAEQDTKDHQEKASASNHQQTIARDWTSGPTQASAANIHLNPALERGRGAKVPPFL